MVARIPPPGVRGALICETPAGICNVTELELPCTCNDDECEVVKSGEVVSVTVEAVGVRTVAHSISSVYKVKKIDNIYEYKLILVNLKWQRAHQFKVSRLSYGIVTSLNITRMRASPHDDSVPFDSGVDPRFERLSVVCG